MVIIESKPDGAVLTVAKKGDQEMGLYQDDIPPNSQSEIMSLAKAVTLFYREAYSQKLYRRFKKRLDKKTIKCKHLGRQS